MKRRPKGSRLFTVGLVSDTHCNEREDFSASPYPANAEANPRARYVMACLQREGPDFVVHLGDMVNPVPELPTYAASVAEFKKIAAGLSMPLHLVPGNHDIGDKPVSWMPAGTIDSHSIDIYQAAFGKHFYAYRHKNVRFIVLNAALINSGLAQESEQRHWLEHELETAPDIRTFVFIHYPLFVSDRDEPGSYDNLEEHGRSWLIDLVETCKPEGLFAAHVHNFWYDVLGETETYILPSTCFVRHDYSEMYRVEPGDQYGRNDAAKLGFAVLDIFEEGHVVHYQRSYGALLKPGDALPETATPVQRVHTKTSVVANLAVDMRRSWAEELDVAPSGAVDEFRRKRARNDYPVMALWEMGLRTMRVPVQDLIDARVRRRMQLLEAVGHRFQVYCYGAPDRALITLLARHRRLVHTLEVVINWEDAVKACAIVREVKNETGIAVCLSRVNRKDAAKFGGNRYNHLISHGFSLAEIDEVTAFLATHDPDSAVSEVMVAVARETCPWQATALADEAAESLGRRVCLYIKSSGSSPAEAFVDDKANAARFMAAALAGLSARAVTVVLDTFTDADRGYFVRTGLVDRRYNPRLAARLMRTLMAAAGTEQWLRAPDGEGRIAIVNADGREIRLRSSDEGVPEIECSN
jgi:predicted phosphodiesterase